MQKNHCFKVDVSVQESMPLIERNKKTVKQLDCGRWYSVGDPVWINADPFLFEKNGRLFLFYEDLHFYHYLGVIKMISTTDLVHWTKPVLITHEPNCHFSYPFVFEDGGQVYMMPETGDKHNIRLYKADNGELTKFSFYKIIMERKDIPDDMVYDYADSCIYKRNGKYYLFTSTMSKETYYLHLYVSDCLTGPYEDHPCTPIVVSSKYGRCAGSLLEHDGHLYRYSQDCSNTYGEQIHLLEIDELTPTSYIEHVVKENILPTDLPFYANGGHQVNFAKFQGKIVVATDAKEDRMFWVERILNKFLKLIRLSTKTQQRLGIQY